MIATQELEQIKYRIDNSSVAGLPQAELVKWFQEHGYELVTELLDRRDRDSASAMGEELSKQRKKK